MNPILEWLSGGDLRSDGMADEVAELVLKNPAMFNEIIARRTPLRKSQGSDRIFLSNTFRSSSESLKVMRCLWLRCILR
jgi:hypothetical protein